MGRTDAGAPRAQVLRSTGARRPTAPDNTIGVADIAEAVPPTPHGVALLDQLCRRALGELAVDAIGVSMLFGRHALTSAYATDESISRLEHETVVLGEGPVWDVLAAHAPVVVADVGTSESTGTWPMWTRSALTSDVCAVASFPIQQGVVVAGTLTLYGRAPRRFDADVRTRAFALADALLLVLLDIAAGVLDEPVSSDPRPVGQVFRPQVHRAAGMVTVQAGITVDEAMVLLRTWSFRHGLTLIEVADQVVGRVLRFDSDESESQ